MINSYMSLEMLFERFIPFLAWANSGSRDIPPSQPTKATISYIPALRILSAAKGVTKSDGVGKQRNVDTVALRNLTQFINVSKWFIVASSNLRSGDAMFLFSYF